MTDLIRQQCEQDVILAEVRRIHEEVTGLHRELVMTLDGMVEILKRLEAVQACDQAINAIVTSMSDRLAGPTLATKAVQDHVCPTCGARLKGHVADAGELLICPTCGWSEFVDIGGHETACVSPASLPVDARPRQAWA